MKNKQLKNSKNEINGSNEDQIQNKWKYQRKKYELFINKNEKLRNRNDLKENFQVENFENWLKNVKSNWKLCENENSKLKNFYLKFPSNFQILLSLVVLIPYFFIRNISFRISNEIEGINNLILGDQF